MEQKIEVVKNKPNDYPCRDCQDRHPGCHPDCAAYLEARERNMAKKAVEKKNIQKHLDYVRYNIESIDRAKKRRGRRPTD